MPYVPLVNNHKRYYPNGKNIGLFFDRDGVINKLPKKGFVASTADLVLHDGAISLLSDLEDVQHSLQLNIYKFIVTNQTGIGVGLYSEEDFLEVQKKLLMQLANHDVIIDGYFYCPHKRPGKGEQYPCSFMKPQTGMVDCLTVMYDIDLDTRIIIGDTDRELVLAQNANIFGIIMDKPSGKVTEKIWKIRNYQSVYNKILEIIQQHQ